MPSYSKYLEMFYDLRTEIDHFCENLAQTHSSHLACKKTCTFCCLNIELTAIEYFAIQNELYEKEIIHRAGYDEGEICKFIFAKKCKIYPARPIQCRVAGLPIAQEGTEEVIACELNFKEYDFSNFGEDNTFPKHIFEQRIQAINEKFINQLESDGQNLADTYTLNQIEYAKLEF